jgi:hypothetical protein
MLYVNCYCPYFICSAGDQLFSFIEESAISFPAMCITHISNLLDKL